MKYFFGTAIVICFFILPLQNLQAGEAKDKWKPEAVMKTMMLEKRCFQGTRKNIISHMLPEMKPATPGWQVRVASPMSID